MAAVAFRHGRRLRRFLSQRVRNRSDAPDLVQEVYLRLLRAERHEEIRSPEAYLLTIATHLLREHTVRQTAMPPMVKIEELVTELHAAPADDPEARTDAQQRLLIVGQALRKLSPKAQAVLLLHRRDGFSLDEIGERLGVSRSMAKKYLTKALSLCRQRMDRAEPE